MTRNQYDKAVCKLHELIERQFCACIKATFYRTLDLNNFESRTGLHYGYDVTYDRGKTYVYVVFAETGHYDSRYEMSNDAAYVISGIGQCEPQKIEIF